MDRIVIGMDPHKRSVTIEARDGREVLRATGTFPVCSTGYRSMLRFARQWPDRVWAVEGACCIKRFRAILTANLAGRTASSGLLGEKEWVAAPALGGRRGAWP